jgi:hypothetical protein
MSCKPRPDQGRVARRDASGQIVATSNAADHQRSEVEFRSAALYGRDHRFAPLAKEVTAHKAKGDRLAVRYRRLGPHWSNGLERWDNEKFWLDDRALI